MLRLNKKGQHTVEYLIMFGIVIAVLIIVMANNSSIFQKAYTDTLKESADGMKDAARDAF